MSDHRRVQLQQPYVVVEHDKWGDVVSITAPFVSREDAFRHADEQHQAHGCTDRYRVCELTSWHRDPTGSYRERTLT